MLHLYIIAVKKVFVPLLNGSAFLCIVLLAELEIEILFEEPENEAETFIMWLGNENSSSSELACWILNLFLAFSLANRFLVSLVMIIVFLYNVIINN